MAKTVILVLHLSSLLKRSSKDTMFMVQTPRKKRKRELSDEQLAVKVFGKRLKKELDKVIETVDTKGVKKLTQ